jgi:hypothetical protein
MTTRLSRRVFLRGSGAAIALPFLEAMLPRTALGAPAAKPPLRMAFLYVPNGVRIEEWKPKGEGALELSPILKPLESVKDYVTVFTGLAQRKSFANGDGPGDHARAMATFLTGCQAKKTAGADIKVGISVDQVAAQKVGDKTRFASLEIGCEMGRDAGNCDSGYSCAYSNNLSWRAESTPNYKEVDPRAVFDRLFGNGKRDPEQERKDLYRRSILDYVTEDAKALRDQLGINDQRKLEEYLCSIRDIERRIVKVQKENTQTTEKDKDPGMARPVAWSREKYEEHLRTMADLLALAFQGDLTRIATFVFANDGSNRAYRFIGISEGHHDLSHHGREEAKLEKLQKINTFHITQFAYLLEKLKGIKEGEGCLLDNCMLVYGSGLSDGNRHNHNDLPIVFAGKGGGDIQGNRHVRLSREVPLNNLFLSMLDRVGAATEKLGDSTGLLTEL